MKVALIAPFDWAGISNPLLNSIQWFLANGWQVDLYTDFDAYQEREGWPPIKPRINLRNIVYGYSRVKTFIQFMIGLVSNSRDYRLNRDYLFSLWYGLKFCRYDLIVGYDEHGLERASLVNKLWKTRLIYHNLEFYEQEDFRKSRERLNSQLANIVLTQDHNRAAFISASNKIPLKNIRVVYNSTICRSTQNDQSYFRRMFDLESSSKIILVTGSLIKEHGIPQLLDALSSLPPKWVVVIHGWASRAIRSLIEQYLVLYPTKLFYSSKLLDFDDKHIIFESVDAGCVVFTGTACNFLYAAGSAGKLYDFMQAGVPILGNNIPGMSDILDRQGCGITANLDHSFFSHLAEIDSNYEELRTASLKAFKKYDFPLNFSSAIDSILYS